MISLARAFAAQAVDDAFLFQLRHAVRVAIATRNVRSFTASVFALHRSRVEAARIIDMNFPE